MTCICHRSQIETLHRRSLELLSSYQWFCDSVIKTLSRRWFPWCSFVIKQQQDETYNIHPRQHVLIAKRQSSQLSCCRPCDLAVMHHSLLVMDRYATTWASITHCVKSQCMKRTVQQLPRCCHGAWHRVLYRPVNVSCNLSDHFLTIGAASDRRESDPHLHNVQGDTSPQTYTKGPARDDNYRVMIVIRIWATHFHKESFNDANESQGGL